MLPAILVSSIVLMMPAQAGNRGHSMLGGRPASKPESVTKPASKPEAAPSAEEPAASPEALAEYNGMKEKAPRTVAGHLKLAEWCEAHGLKAEAQLHYFEVVRLDPKRESVWRKLGYRKVGHRWMSEVQMAESEEQKKTDRLWAPRLRKIHRDIHGSNGPRKRDAAWAEFEAIRDERAIPSMYREFGGSQIDQLLLIGALERIERPLATRSLAMLAIYGRTPEVRRRATEILRGRSSDDYLELLVGLLVDTLHYEVKNVAGPGLPGVLFVEGQRYNVARFYAPPPPPGMMPLPGDIISYDQIGMPVVTRSLGPVGSFITRPGHQLEGYTLVEGAQISASQMIQEAQKGAAAAESQLEGDVSQLKALNDSRRHFNELVISVASYATGKTFGPEVKDWRKAVHAEKQYEKEPRPNKPTVTEMVNLAYQPQFAQIGFMRTPLIDH